MSHNAPIAALATIIAQSTIEEGWIKVLLQLGIAGAWLYWLTGHLKDQTARDDKRHSENITVANNHARAMERLTLTCYDVLDELGDAYPHAKQRVREVIRKDAREAIDHDNKS